MDVNDVAGILFAETRGMRDRSAAAGAPASTDLDKLRKNLADLVTRSQDGVGFAVPTQPSTYDLGDPDLVSAWQNCYAAARSPTANGDLNVAFFSANDPQQDNAFLTQYPWLKDATKPVAGGTVKNGNVDETLWLTRSTVGYGRYPRTDATLDYSFVSGPGLSTIFGGVLFLICLAILVVPAGVIWRASHAFVQELQDTKKQTVAAAAADTKAEQAAAAKKKADATSQDKADKLAVAQKALEAAKKAADAADAKPDAHDKLTQVQAAFEQAKADDDAAKDAAAAAAIAATEADNRRGVLGIIDLEKLNQEDVDLAKLIAAGSSAQDKAGTLEDKQKAIEVDRKKLYRDKIDDNDFGQSIVAWWVASLVGIVSILALVSYALRKDVFNFLVDERGRMSLSRFQLAAWTIVILAAYWAAAAWNIGATTPLSGWILPGMSTDLWILLGIATTSPLLSALIVGVRAQATDTGSQAGATSGTDQATNTGTRKESTPAPVNVPEQNVTQRGVIDKRIGQNAWSFADLFTGEEVANRDSVDLSRVQQFVFTLVTLLAFVSLTVQRFSSLDPGARIVQLPPLDATLIGLLAISHLAYLGAKSLPKT